MKLVVNRKIKTVDGILGDLLIDQNPFCYTLENLALAIAPGIYPVKSLLSPHFGREMPHIVDVPGRTDLMFHWANYPLQLKGCIALGNKEDPDAIENSIFTFNQFINILSGSNDITVEIREEYPNEEKTT